MSGEVKTPKEKGKKKANPKEYVVALLGTIGAGKTHLYRKLTHDYNLVEAKSATSVTHRLFSRKVQITTDDKFFVVDGPGNDATKDVQRNAMLIRNMLTKLFHHMLLVVVKYENRIDMMIQNYEKSIDPIIKLDAIHKQLYDDQLRELEGKLKHRRNYDKNKSFKVSETVKNHDEGYWKLKIDALKLNMHAPYSDMIAVIITHADHIVDDDGAKTKENIIKVFTGEHLKIKTIHPVKND
jgi:hypothetical protein